VADDIGERMLTETTTHRVVIAFAATLEWGTEVRGRYELVVAPQLIVMEWDFDDVTVPAPGRPMTGYLRVFPLQRGARVGVQQLVDTVELAASMEAAWGMVLGRLKTGVVAASDPAVSAPARPRRTKTRRGA
jgi:uncharacterized protein YndB with AHSA1/START domain